MQKRGDGRGARGRERRGGEETETPR